MRYSYIGSGQRQRLLLTIVSWLVLTKIYIYKNSTLRIKLSLVSIFAFFFFFGVFGSSQKVGCDCTSQALGIDYSGYPKISNINNCVQLMAVKSIWSRHRKCKTDETQRGNEPNGNKYGDLCMLGTTCQQKDMIFCTLHLNSFYPFRFFFFFFFSFLM